MDKKLLVFFYFILCSYLLSAQTIDENYLKKHYQKKEYQIEMRDGVHLYTAVYTPHNRDEKHPILLQRTPYSCRPYGESDYHKSLWSSYYREYIQEEYIFVFQDVRGKWMSEGEFRDMVEDPSDTYDTVDWLVKNIRGNNGKVGLFGISYPGFYAIKGALCGHPAIAAVSPQAPAIDWFMGDDFHHNGAFMLEDAFRFHINNGRPRKEPHSQAIPGSKVEQLTDNYQFFLRQGSLKNLTLLTGDSIRFWNEMMAHPHYDEWWKARDVRRSCYNIKPAILIVGGLFDTDDCFGAWNLYKAIKQQSPQTDARIVFGPWFHGSWSANTLDKLYHLRFGSNTAAYYQQQIEIPFFQYHLKGKGDLKNLSEAIIYFSGKNQWEHFHRWPPRQTRERQLFFGENHTLSFEPPATTHSFTSYISDPARPVPLTNEIRRSRNSEYMIADQRFAERRTDVITFQTDILEEDLTVAGPLTAHLQVAISTTDIDLVVKIIDVYPDDFSQEGENAVMGGFQMLVRGDVMRGRYRNSFEEPEAFIPGEITKVGFELPDIAHTFLKGHRLMIQIQSSWFPLVDRNPQQFVDIYQCDDSDFIPSEVKIFHQKDAASQIILRIKD